VPVVLRTLLLEQYLPNRSHSPFVMKLLMSPPLSSCNCRSNWNATRQK